MNNRTIYPQIPRQAFMPSARELQIALAPAAPADEPQQGNWTFVPHVHDFMELVLILSGTATQWINGHTYPVFFGFKGGKGIATGFGSRGLQTSVLFHHTSDLLNQ